MEFVINPNLSFIKRINPLHLLNKKIAEMA